MSLELIVGARLIISTCTRVKESSYFCFWAARSWYTSFGLTNGFSVFVSFWIAAITYLLLALIYVCKMIRSLTLFVFAKFWWIRWVLRIVEGQLGVIFETVKDYNSISLWQIAITTKEHSYFLVEVSFIPNFLTLNIPSLSYYINTFYNSPFLLFLERFMVTPYLSVDAFVLTVT